MKTAQTSTDAPVQEFASFKELFRRQRQRIKKKQMGVKPGSGYEIRGGVKRRIAPQKLMALKKRGRLMSRSAKQQRAMWMGRQRAKSLSGMKPKFAGGQRLKSDVDINNPDIPKLNENERRFNSEHILRAIEEWKRGNVVESLRRLTIDPKYQLTPIAGLADEIVRKMRSEGVDKFVDVEIVEGESLAIYLERAEGDDVDITELVGEYGDVGLVARPEDAISDSQVSGFFVYMLQPEESVLKTFVYTEDEDEEGVAEDDSGMPTGKVPRGGVLAQFQHVGVNRPTMKTYGGVGTDTDVNPPPNDVAHLRPSDDDDDPVIKRMNQKFDKRRKEKIARKADLPLGVDPNLGQ